MNLVLRNRVKSKYSSQPRIKIRRGIANIVSTAILLSAVSIMGVMMLAWANGSMLEQRMEIEHVFNTQMNKINEDLIFENIWFPTTPPPNHVNITMTNTGILGLNVTEIHVTENNNEKFIFYFTNGGIPKSDSFSVNTSYDWNSNDELEILVFTQRGNQYITQVVAP